MHPQNSSFIEKFRDVNAKFSESEDRAETAKVGKLCVNLTRFRKIVLRSNESVELKKKKNLFSEILH